MTEDLIQKDKNANDSVIIATLKTEFKVQKPSSPSQKLIYIVQILI